MLQREYCNAEFHTVYIIIFADQVFIDPTVLRHIRLRSFAVPCG